MIDRQLGTLLLGLCLGVVTAACGRAEKAAPPAAGSAATVAPPHLPPDHAAPGHGMPEEHPAANAAPYVLTVTPGTPVVAGKATPLTLELKSPDGARVVGLDVVHEKLLHLIIVSTDLSYFSHEHPERQADGTLTHQLTLPHAGGYLLFADFTPTGGSRVIAQTPFVVPGEAPPMVPLVAAPLPSKGTFGSFDVTLSATPAPTAGASTLLAFAVSQQGKPVTDFQNYLGARGHCVIISEDTTKFLHSHPLDAKADGGSGSAADASVQFHTVFPGPGKYKVWAEFRPGGATLITSFIVEIPAGTGAGSGAPASDPMTMPMEHGHDMH